jgi:hypothetical protein
MSIQKQMQNTCETKICFRCYQKIYQLEILGPILKQFYHKTCFRCIYCDRYLDFKNYATNTHDLSDKHVYCSSHVPKTKNQYVFCENKTQTSTNSNLLDIIQIKSDSDSKKNLKISSNENVCAKIKISLSYIKYSNKLSILIHEAM